MNAGIIAAIVYGLLALAGGAMGYAKAKSKPSLISGIVSGLLLLLSSWMALQGSAIGLKLAAVVTATLVVVFAIRLRKTRKFMPAGLMLVAGAIALTVIIAQ